MQSQISFMEGFSVFSPQIEPPVWRFYFSWKDFTQRRAIEAMCITEAICKLHTYNTFYLRFISQIGGDSSFL